MTDNTAWIHLPKPSPATHLSLDHLDLSLQAADQTGQIRDLRLGLSELVAVLLCLGRHLVELVAKQKDRMFIIITSHDIILSPGGGRSPSIAFKLVLSNDSNI